MNWRQVLSYEVLCLGMKTQEGFRMSLSDDGCWPGSGDEASSEDTLNQAGSSECVHAANCAGLTTGCDYALANVGVGMSITVLHPKERGINANTGRC